MIHQNIEAIARIVEIPEDYLDLVLVRCPFCGEVHQHGVSRGEKLLGEPVHQGADCCTLDGAYLYRGRRRKQLEEGKALYVAAGGSYHVPLYISLYLRFRNGEPVGHRVGEVRK